MQQETKIIDINTSNMDLPPVIKLDTDKVAITYIMLRPDYFNPKQQSNTESSTNETN
jgi:hypothetical protein